MTRQHSILLALTALISLIGCSRVEAQDSVEIHQAALTLEEGKLHEFALDDPDTALTHYERVLELADTPDDVMAQALLRKSFCLRTLGRRREAERGFREVIDAHATQEAVVDIARRQVCLPASLLPPETMLYVELVDPQRQIGALTELIRGTPLENPVNTYLALAPRDQASNLPLPNEDAINKLRAVLNLSFLKEFQKIDGLAVGLVSVDESNPDFVAVVLPGKSVLMRGVLKMFLGSGVEGLEESVDGMRVFRLRLEDQTNETPLYAAMDGQEKVVMIGTPRSRVEESIRRYSDPRIPSLGDSDDFLEARAVRQGSLVFAYAERSRVLKSIRAAATAKDRGEFDILSTLVGLDHLQSIGAGLSLANGNLQLTVGAVPTPDPGGVWPAIRTPVLDPSFAKFIPDDALAILALPVPGLVQRIKKTVGAIEKRMPVIAAQSLSSPRKWLAGLDASLREKLQRVGEDLTEFVIVIPRQQKSDLRGPHEAFYLLLRFRDGAAIERDLEDVLAAIAHTLVPNRASLKFGPPASQLLGGLPGFTLRVLEPSPGFMSGFARHGNFVVVAPSLRTLRASLAKALKGMSFSPSKIPAAASKVVCVQPRLLFGALAEHPAGNPIERFIRQTPQVTLYTVEPNDRFFLQLHVPDVAPVLKKALGGLTD